MSGRRRSRRLVRQASRIAGLVLLSAMPLLGGCEGLLDVARNPDTISAEGIEGPGSLPARLVGSESDFVAAFDNAALYGGLFADELAWGGSFVNRDEIDRRNIDPGNDIVASELYAVLQTAAKTSKDLQREMLDNRFPVQIPDPSNATEFARMSLWSGYSRLLLADFFCTLAFDGHGPELGADDVYQIAVEDFTSAINAGRAAPGVVSAALVGRARARLQLGGLQEAAADAAAVAAGFEFVLQYSTNSAREENAVYNFINGNRRLTIDTPFRNLTIDVSGEPDPRAATVSTGQFTFNGELPLWTTAKYASQSAPIRLASWEEAQLMIAEIEGGAMARDIINELRAARGITQVFDAGGTATDEEILAKLIDERGRALFLESQRAGDLRRYRERYGIDLYTGRMPTQDQTCMPLPDLERDNNPDLSVTR